MAERLHAGSTQVTGYGLDVGSPAGGSPQQLPLVGLAEAGGSGGSGGPFGATAAAAASAAALSSASVPARGPVPLSRGAHWTAITGAHASAFLPATQIHIVIARFHFLQA